jgi:DNA-binding MarR family transcriptional regulator/N-acetylglutamate synthase-like GNAT family acetyltransferase
MVDSVNYRGIPCLQETAMADTLRERVEAVRKFNRFYTKQIGALQEGLLNSPFSLTEVRVLFELANRRGPTAVELCWDLGLDAGYLSRILRGFEKKGLVARAASKSDARQSLLSLTGKGQKVFAPLNRKSSKEVARMLAPLSEAQQQSLVAAMEQVEQIVAPSPSLNTDLYSLRDPRPGDMGWVVHRHGAIYFEEWGYDERFEGLVARIVGKFIEKFDEKSERCWIAERGGQIIGSVFLVKESKSVAKLRLLLVEPSARGLGLGKRLVEECVSFARKAGYRKIVLWTQSELLAARHIYERSGFKLAGEERHSSWGRKELVSEVWEKEL